MIDLDTLFTSFNDKSTCNGNVIILEYIESDFGKINDDLYFVKQ